MNSREELIQLFIQRIKNDNYNERLGRTLMLIVCGMILAAITALFTLT